MPAGKFWLVRKTVRAAKFRSVGLAPVNIPSIPAPFAPSGKETARSEVSRRVVVAAAAASSAGVDGCVGVIGLDSDVGRVVLEGGEGIASISASGVVLSGNSSSSFPPLPRA
jgi:hypothetical protein